MFSASDQTYNTCQNLRKNDPKIEMCLKVGAFCCGKSGNSGGAEVIWEFDDRLKLEQVRAWIERRGGLRNSVIHVLPVPRPLSKQILCFEIGCHPGTHLLQHWKYKKKYHYAIKRIGNQGKLLKRLHIAMIWWFDCSYHLRSAINLQLRKGTIQAQLRKLSKSWCVSLWPSDDNDASWVGSRWISP